MADRTPRRKARCPIAPRVTVITASCLRLVVTFHFRPNAHILSDMRNKILTSALALMTLGSAATAADLSNIVQAELRPGWRKADGTHMTALQLTLAPGWKTYWRAPGDAGIPPSFDWSGSSNMESVGITWPTPKVMYQSGMRSVGYSDQVVFPIQITPSADGDINLNARVDLGLCKDICLPHSVTIRATLTADTTKPDPVIAAALSDRPFSEKEAGVGKVTCDIAPSSDGVTLTARIPMADSGGKEETVIETSNPMIWVSEPDVTRQGKELITAADLSHVEGKPFALDRSGIRITVLGKSYAVDIKGCDG